MTEFAAELRGKATPCKFGDALPVMLRDRFVCGIRNERIQCSLLKTEDLTFDQAIQIATAQEEADRGAKDIAGEQ